MAVSTITDEDHYDLEYIFCCKKIFDTIYNDRL